jgi:putative effector of murein hydrolase LrgA (UPF0299 family)
MIVSLTVILFCQLLGEVVTRGLGWPLPVLFWECSFCSFS